MEVSVVSATDPESAIELTEESDGSWSYVFQSAGTYTVTLSITDDSTATKGYCRISVNGETEIKTAPISKDSEIGVNPFEFTINILEFGVGTKVVFTPALGISANENMQAGYELICGSN